MGFNSILELMLVKLAEHSPLHAQHISQHAYTLQTLQARPALLADMPMRMHGESGKLPKSG